MKTKKKNLRYGVIDADLTPADLVTIHSGHIDYFDKLHARGKENELYFQGMNLSSKQEDDYYKQDRIPFPNAITADKLQRIISTERNSRTFAKAEARIKQVKLKPNCSH